MGSQAIVRPGLEKHVACELVVSYGSAACCLERASLAGHVVSDSGRWPRECNEKAYNAMTKLSSVSEYEQSQ